MTDPRIEKLADVLVNYSTAVQRDERVVIQGNTLAAPLLQAVYTKVLQAGGHPLMMASLPDAEELFYRYASDDQLQHVPDPIKLVVETYDVSIYILGEGNTKALSNVDPANMVLASQARTELKKIRMQRAAAGELRWVVTLFPTNAYAQDAEMSLSEYEDFVYGACMPDEDDPVGYLAALFGLAAKDRRLAQRERARAHRGSRDRSASEHRRTLLHQQRRQE